MKLLQKRSKALCPRDRPSPCGKSKAEDWEVERLCLAQACRTTLLSGPQLNVALIVSSPLLHPKEYLPRRSVERILF